jgi:uncharacterized protein YgbK (DUF1537 family)
MNAAEYNDTSRPRVAAIADDVTGATDLAGSWRARGYRSMVILGEPRAEDESLLASMDAVTYALKIRSVDAPSAAASAGRVASALHAQGVPQVYDKYCSTFDSTAEGNIGPIADAIAEAIGARRAVVVPSMPANGRTVYQGHLFVHDQLLDESPMRRHPLNPMTDSSLVRLLQAQTRRDVGMIPLATVRKGSDALRSALDTAQENGTFYLVVDAIDDHDLEVIHAATADDVLVTGGSGLASGAPSLAERPEPIPRFDGRKVILAGSASAATRGQVEYARSLHPTRALDLGRTVEDPDTVARELVAWAGEQWALDPQRPVLIHSDATALDAATPPAGLSAAIETVLGKIASGVYDAGARQFLIAGGETSGAVIDALGIRQLELGDEVDPGVSWLAGRGPGDDDHAGGRQCNLLLKSGNFGNPHIFENAWETL